MKGAAIFQAYLASYRAAIGAIRYRDVATMQPAPHASLAHGGIGTAYALWRLGEQRRAKQWLVAAGAERRASGYAWPDYAPPATSYHYGRAALHWVRSMMGDRTALTSYLRLARRSEAVEIMSGAAGHLTGIRLLLARGDDRRLRNTGDALAARILASLAPRATQPWTATDAAGGFAHDWIGALHALLEWSRAAQQSPAPLVIEVLEQLASVWSPRTVRVPGLAGAWCQGAGGAALVWSSAYSTTNDRVFLRCARDAGQILIAAEHVAADLCCGWGGACFALLELDRIDPKSGWRRRARELAARRITALPGMRWPSGLFRGHPGLVCLALDLVDEHPRGFPTILG